MHNTVGVWIDHKQVFMVFAGKEVQRVESGMEPHIRFSGRALQAEGSADDQRDRQYTTHLNKYYDKVIALISGADAIFLMGPGEAKTEFRSRLQLKKLGERIVKMETAGKMTPAQIAAKTRRFFEVSA